MIRVTRLCLFGANLVTLWTACPPPLPAHDAHDERPEGGHGVRVLLEVQPGGGQGQAACGGGRPESNSRKKISFRWVTWVISNFSEILETYYL